MATSFPGSVFSVDNGVRGDPGDEIAYREAPTHGFLGIGHFTVSHR